MAMRRREILSFSLATGAFLASPAFASRTARPKDHDQYTKVLDSLFVAWWARDYAGFRRWFHHPEVTHPFDGRALFDAHYHDRGPHSRGAILFNGSSAVVQIVTPQKPDYVHAIGDGNAFGDLFLATFFPGLEAAVLEKLSYLNTDVLAPGEWASSGAGTR